MADIAMKPGEEILLERLTDGAGFRMFGYGAGESAADQITLPCKVKFVREQFKIRECATNSVGLKQPWGDWVGAWQVLPSSSKYVAEPHR